MNGLGRIARRAWGASVHRGGPSTATRFGRRGPGWSCRGRRRSRATRGILAALYRQRALAPGMGERPQASRKRGARLLDGD